MVKDKLGDRMKTFYEEIPKTRLMRRTPVIIRIDGKAFHTLTKNFKKPFDHALIRIMQDTMRYLCRNIQGCVLGYTQSDEITLVLIDYQTLETSAWFDNEVQKICSVSASMATFAFNRSLNRMFEHLKNEDLFQTIMDVSNPFALEKAADMGALFDARCFSIPKEEVANCLLWRQLDAIRNSIEMAGHAFFSPKEMHGKNTEMIKEMLLDQKGISWDDYPADCRMGSCCIKTQNAIKNPDGSETMRSKWEIDHNIPIFKDEGREYINSRILYEES